MSVGVRVLGLLGLGLGLVAACGGDGSSHGTGAAGSPASAGSSGSGGGGGSGTVAGGSTAGGQSGASQAGSSTQAGAGSGGTPNPAASKLEACLAYVKEFCAATYKCDGRTNTGSCERATDPQCPDVLFSEGSTRTPASLAACAATWATLSCDDYEKGKQPTCITPGSKALGESCAFPSQCSSLACSATSGSCGMCVASAVAGGPCTVTSQCPGGQTCDGANCADGVVRSIVALGAPCDPTHYCDDPSYCNSAGTCAVYPTAGAPCNESGACATGSYCDANLQCVAPPGAGQPCLNVANIGMVCGGNSTCMNNLCVALPTEGQPCFAAGGAVDCANGFWCHDPDGTRICKALGSTPDCDIDYDCGPGATCRDKLCKALIPFHAPCDADHLCSATQATCTNGKCEPVDSLGLFATRCPK